MSLPRLFAPVLVAAALLTACGSSGEPDASTPEPGSSDAGAFPVSIDHAYGTTEIADAPERVVTWGWASTDAAIAMGVVPVAIPYADYGGDDEGVLPWIREALEEQGEEIPERLPQTEGEAPIEAIAAARPDLILAPYSGITEAEYELLAQIAPTVAFPEQAWATPWRETIEIVGEALGRPEAADEVLAEIDATVAEAAADHPELEGKTVANIWPTREDVYVYKPADARVAFLADLGLVSAPSVDELASGEETFYFMLSPERLGDLESDILVSYADTEAEASEFLDAPAAQVMAQVRDGSVAQVTGTDLISAVSPPSALSLTWGLDEYVELLSAAATAADAG